MRIQITGTQKITADDVAIICNNNLQFDDFNFTTEELEFMKNEFNNKQTLVLINRYSKRFYICIQPNEKEPAAVHEKLRRTGVQLTKALNKIKAKNVVIVDLCKDTAGLMAFCEGIALSAYQFLDFFSKKVRKKKENTLEKIKVVTTDNDKIKELQYIVEAVFQCRDLINTPVNYLSAVQFAKKMKAMGEEAGYTTTIFDKKKIESLRLGGLLAVNKGSVAPPTFTVMEWKPEQIKNTKPIVLVGKGVVYDTGGLSLKPTLNSMDFMKSDMGGGAVVAGIMYAIAKNKLPLHVVGIVPATDNRPGKEAFAPGDIIKMYDGTMVENMNSDAEGRYLLADGLSYAKKYDPELVIDIATLTGAAHYSIGSQATVVMGTADESIFDQLKEHGKATHERVVEFPLWEEYGEVLKSTIADIKNIGGPVAGAITAGKFLEHFTDYPWIHDDIAGNSFFQKASHYSPAGGTGCGIRRYYSFFKNYSSPKIK